MSADWKFKTTLARSVGKVPAAGAWDSSPVVVPSGWALDGILYVEQVQDGATSAAQFRVEVTPDDDAAATPVWYFVPLTNPTITVVAAEGFAQSEDTWLRRLPTRNGNWAFPLVLLSGARALRVSFSEYGDNTKQTAIGARVVLRGAG